MQELAANIRKIFFFDNFGLFWTHPKMFNFARRGRVEGVSKASRMQVEGKTHAIMFYISSFNALRLRKATTPPYANAISISGHRASPTGVGSPSGVVGEIFRGPVG